MKLEKYIFNAKAVSTSQYRLTLTMIKLEYCPILTRGMHCIRHYKLIPHVVKNCFVCGEPIFVDFVCQPNDQFMNPMKNILYIFFILHYAEHQ